MGIFYGLEIYGVKIVKKDNVNDDEEVLYERLFDFATKEISEEVINELNKITDFTDIRIYYYKEFTCSYEFDLETSKMWVIGKKEEFKKFIETL